MSSIEDGRSRILLRPFPFCMNEDHLDIMSRFGNNHSCVEPLCGQKHLHVSVEWRGQVFQDSELLQTRVTMLIACRPAFGKRGSRAVVDSFIFSRASAADAV